MTESSANSAASIKKVLVDAGFEVFRSRGEEIVLAERPRENLIMDSGVRLRVGQTGQGIEVRVVLRAQQADFPNEDESGLFERVRRLAAPALSEGFIEAGTSVTPIMDPSNAGRTLDTFYEITYAKRARALDDALAELRFALSLEKRAEIQTRR
jgi:hypothetical protein